MDIIAKVHYSQSFSCDVRPTMNALLVREHVLSFDQGTHLCNSNSYRDSEHSCALGKFPRPPSQ